MDPEERKSGEEEEEGAIRKLSQDLLCHVLSFLSTKDAALTSVLSKRWRDLFTRTPSLDLDDSIFVPGQSPREYKGTSFIDFVNRVLTLRSNSPITKFSLKCHSGVDEDLVGDWVGKALRRGATDLTFRLIFPSQGYSLPSSLFSNAQNLIKLRLGCGTLGLFQSLTHGRDFIFTKLKTLQFDSIQFSEKGTDLALLLSKSPVLEELILLDCAWRSAALVSCPTLKRLTIDTKHNIPRRYCSPSYIDLGTNSYPVRAYLEFDTPNLIYLNYSDSAPRNYPLVEMDSLVIARLDVGSAIAQMRVRDSYNRDEVRRDATTLIMGIHNVQTLHLTSVTLEMFSFLGETVPVFHNVTHLSIEINDERGWQFLPLLLIKCPNLQTLVFHGLHQLIGDACDGRSLFSSCLSSCPVKFLKILEFGATLAEMSLVEHFLKRLPLLEQVNIVSSQDEEFDLFQVSEALKMAPRASPNCQLLFA